MKPFFLNIFILLCLPSLTIAQKEINFNNLDSLFSFADKNSSVTKTNEQQALLARYQKIAALANTINFRNPVAFTLTDNTTLPVNYIPSNLLGGPAGSFKEITLGQQYVSNFNITPQIDIINPGAWAQIKSANINLELTSTRNLLNRKSLFESLAACYFNISSLQEQISITQKNMASADTLFLIVNNKFEQGLVRQQDVNDASINKISMQDKAIQLQVSLEQQYNSLKILCDLPLNSKLTFQQNLNYDQTFSVEMNATSSLQTKYYSLQSIAAKADLNFNRLANLPVLSLSYSNSHYQNSINKFFDNNPNNKWLNSEFVGAKLTFFLPDVNRLLMARNANISYQIALVNMEHNKLQNDIANNQLQLDYQKMYSQFITSKNVFLLKEENYNMAFNQYSQSILPFDKLLTAFNDMLISRFNYSGALATLMYSKSKIDINNKIK